MKLNIIIQDHLEQEVEWDNGILYLDGKAMELDIIKLGTDYFHVLKNGKSFEVEINRKEGKSLEILINGKTYSAKVMDSLQIMLQKLGMSETKSKAALQIKAPMPGLILRILVEKGMEIKAGDPIIILEAMKMENILKATSDCLVEDIKVKAGEKVEKGQSLVILG